MSDQPGSDPFRPNEPERPPWQSTPPPPPYGQQYGTAPMYGTPPDNYLVWAILSTVLCCLPLGIASIVFSSQVNSKFAAGDLAGAQESSRRAKNFAIWSAVASAASAVLLVIGIAVLAATSGSGSTSP